jgi:hypothetical protein
MRRIGLASLFATACFNPGDPASDGGATASTDTGAASTDDASADAASTDGTPTGSDPTTDPTEASADTSTAGASSSGGADTSTTADSSSDTGPLPGCGDFDGRVVYVNMSGADLSMGIIDNAPAGITSNAQLVGTWPGYTTDDADELFALVEGHFAPFHVCLTRDVPLVPDYSMIVVSSEAFEGNPNVIGFDIIDCGDTAPNSVTIIFLSEKAGLATATKAVGLSKHVAHMFGLDSVADAPDDLMNQFVALTLNGAGFTETCYAKVTGAMCDSAVGCAAGEQQSGPYLEALFGPA